MQMKTKILEELGRSWSGTLNEENIQAVARRMRLMFYGQHFAIASIHHIDTVNATTELRTDAFINSQWTDGDKELIRVWPGEWHGPSDLNKTRFYMSAHISFSAGGYVWTDLRAAEKGSTDHKDYRIPYIEFSHDYKGDCMKFTSRAPAGKGYLHQHLFTVQTRSGKPDRG